MGRGWCFAAGLPVGALAGLACWGADPLPLAGCGLVGALVLAAVCQAAARGGREAGVAAAAQVGWLAAPVAGHAWLGIGPGPWVGAAAVAGLLLAALVLLAPRSAAPPLLVALVALVVGNAGWAAVSGVHAAWGAAPPALGEATAAAIYDLDARVATRPLPVCGDAAARVTPILDRGAHPRLAADGAALWFDAEVSGRRQVHSLDLASGEVACVTCEEAGNNRRPAPSEHGRAIVFDSDRHGSPLAPANTELFHMRTPAGGPRHAARRLTYHPGRDDHALVAPGGASLLWSRHEGGRFSVVSARFRTGHGALLLAEPNAVVAGGARWIAPLAWSPDARVLASGAGNPFAGLSGESLDPATGESAGLGEGVLGVAFSADAGRTAVVRSDADAGLGGLPPATGFLLGALPRASAARPRGGGTLLVAGETGGVLSRVDLGEAAGWGTPTGVTSSPDGTWLVLGQRSRDEGGFRERLVRVTLDCAVP